MNKKILAAAVAGALAVPAIAFAQAAPTVTITGTLGVSFEDRTFSGATALPSGASPRTSFKNDTTINDDVSIITFGVNEPINSDLGFIGQFQIRPCLDGGTAAGTQNQLVCTTTAEDFVGLRSMTWGQIKMGAITISGAPANGRGNPYSSGYSTFTNHTGFMYSTARAPNYNAAGVIIGASGQIPGSGNNTGSGRVVNAAQWISPDWSGFNLRLGYSTSGIGTQDSDLNGTTLDNVVGGTLIRKGYMVTMTPEYITSRWNVGFTANDNKPDNTPLESKQLNVWGQFKVNDALSLYGEVAHSQWINDQTSAANIAAGTAITSAATATVLSANCAVAIGSTTNPITCSDKLADDWKWDVSAQYVTGPHTFVATYIHADADKVIPGDTKAQEMHLIYSYAFSKRTSVWGAAIRVTNGANVGYSIGGASATSSYIDGGAQAVSFNGESTTWLGVGIKNNF